MKTDISKIYMDWLLSQIYDPGGEKLKTHRKLIAKMHTIPFVVKNPNDYPREGDGIDLRWWFKWDRNISLDDSERDDFIFVTDIPETCCSILEMIVALAFRTDENFTRETNNRSSVPKMFWEMIQNMGLMGETDLLFDEDHVSMVLQRFNEREYEPDGRGGLFYFPNHPEVDMREVEIWYQLCWYINSKTN